MIKKTVSQAAVKRITPSNIVKRLTEALMVKTGIKAGPEGTCG